MRYLIFIFLHVSFSAFCQKLTFNDCQDAGIVINYSNGDAIESYFLSDNSELRVGSALKMGFPVNGNSLYTYCYFGEFSTGKALLAPPQQLAAGYAGEDIVITALKVQHTKLSKTSPLQVMIFVENPQLGMAMKNRTIFNIEKALEMKEVINPNAAMSREEAIAKLKEAKDLLDLGLMTQDDYNDLKLKLTPIITK